MSKLVWRSFCGKIVKNTVSWTYVISDFSGEKIFGKFFKKWLHKGNPKEFRVEKAIKRKWNKLYVKGKDYYSFFNNWINKRDKV